MSEDKKISRVKLNTESIKSAILFTVSKFLEKHYTDEQKKMSDTFTNQYNSLLDKHQKEDNTDFYKLLRMITEFKPALLTILKPSSEFDSVCEWVIVSLNVYLLNAKRQMADIVPSRPKDTPVMPGSDQSTNIKYFCTVCKQTFDIPPEIKNDILDGAEDITFPKHHDKEMVIQIVSSKKEAPKLEKKGKIELESNETAEFLMGHSDTKDANVEYLKILSVGIDIGSSTSHLIFSNLTLRRETSFFNMTNRFFLVNREIIYESEIILTPLLDRLTIDIEAIVKFCQAEYEKADIKPEDVETGAVIVTGETAKKHNAEEIVTRLSSGSGKFVSAAAGPNFESVLGAMGSGIVDLSRVEQRTILNVDIGGGTSNIAIATKGEIHSTSCINIGGRLLGIDENNKIWRIDEPTNFVMKELKMQYKLGDTITKEDVASIVNEYAKALVEVLIGPAKSTITKGLMMTEDLDFSIPVDGYSFSGGVAELIYDETNIKEYNDIGIDLAKEIKKLMKEQKLPLVEPENKIRATVIGAGAFSLSVSGSTCYYDESVKLPIANIPVVPVKINQTSIHLVESNLKEAIDLALNNYDLKEGEDIFALYFKTYFIKTDVLEGFARALEKALPKTIAKKGLILLILSFDGAKMLGITIRDKTVIKSNLFCLDELVLEAGDWIDIGAPLHSGDAFPVTIKSLVFNKNKE